MAGWARAPSVVNLFTNTNAQEPDCRLNYPSRDPEFPPIHALFHSPSARRPMRGQVICQPSRPAAGFAADLTQRCLSEPEISLMLLPRSRL